MSQRGLQTIVVTAIVIACSLAGTRAWAENGWTFIVTPQLWLTHIEKNGFAAPSGLGANPLAGPGGTLLFNQFKQEELEQVDTIDPQWGLQLAAQKGRWTVAGSFQYVSFETRSDIVYRPSNGLPLISPLTLSILPPGGVAAKESVFTTRMDMDFAVSYAFPDVVPNRLDMSVGAGAKVIYATASREYNHLSPFAAEFGALPPAGLYLTCKKDDCSDGDFTDRVKTTDVFYGITIPTSATLHLTNDNRWLLPFSISPFFGGETRDDHDVVYRRREDGKVDRLDGTTFAVGVTADMTLRYLITDDVSLYGGVRVQFIKGHEQYLAYGPLIGMSVRFGGK